QKKGHFFKGIFATQNRNINSKLAPRLRQFLTNLYYYAVEKDLKYFLSKLYLVGVFQMFFKYKIYKYVYGCLSATYTYRFI
ncbi:MAG: hypothetical protein WAS56_14860, partial [Saprospiraceae bacterium]